jgi:thioredoxin-like negative regulator of GroEL
MPDNAPHALLFTAPGCPHCPGVRAALEKLHKEGVISSLQTVSIADAPERAEELGIRSVPWLQLGEFILTGAQTPQQLRQWAERAASGEMSDYLRDLLANGELAAAEVLLSNAPQHLPALLSLLEAADAPMQVRMGVSAIIEALEGTQAVKELLPVLIEMSHHSDHRLRSDACYFLGLSHSTDALPSLNARLDDDSSEVGEIAAEAIAMIRENTDKQR